MQSLERPAYQGASGLGLKIPGAELALILASIQAVGLVYISRLLGAGRRGTVSYSLGRNDAVGSH